MQINSPRYFLEIAYKGSAYHGWQIQDNAVSVQEKLNQALMTILRMDNVETIGAGRTDTGVHAKQLYVHFDVTDPSLIGAPERFLRALNAVLPADIAAIKIMNVSTEAHARFDATSRAYEYHIHFAKNPFLQNSSCHLRDVPDLAQMNEAAKYLLGTQDFACFSKTHTQVFTTVCTITRAQWEISAEGIVFHIAANRFLRNMVRSIVGTLLEISRKGLPVSHMKAVIASHDRSKAGASVPACGLYLTRVSYPYID